ncbi:hypothetical protein [Microbacterium kunmingense]|uniref:hypothetical protein n=1 Tax=Microbacterium kunmingense TaxID=2915939 RepID=UPI002005A2E3|nr:hypothetical protein [Microbacterium kunmingense]
MKRLAPLALAALLLTGCAAQAAPEPTPTATADPFEAAWALCIGAHPDTGLYADPDGEGQVEQTPEQSCHRWVTETGERSFTKTWTEEYAENYRLVFGE